MVVYGRVKLESIVEAYRIRSNPTLALQIIPSNYIYFFKTEEEAIAISDGSTLIYELEIAEDADTQLDKSQNVPYIKDLEIHRITKLTIPSVDSHETYTHQFSFDEINQFRNKFVLLDLKRALAKSDLITPKKLEGIFHLIEKIENKAAKSADEAHYHQEILKLRRVLEAFASHIGIDESGNTEDSTLSEEAFKQKIAELCGTNASPLFALLGAALVMTAASLSLACGFGLIGTTALAVVGTTSLLAGCGFFVASKARPSELENSLLEARVTTPGV